MESLKRMVGVLVAPGDTFRKIAERPTWAVALVVLILLGAVTTFLVMQKVDPDAQREMFRDQIEENQGLRGEELEQVTDQWMEGNAAFAPFFPAFVVVFGILAYALVAVYFLVAVKLAGGEIGFRRSFATGVHGLVPQGVGALLAIPLLLTRESIDPETAQGGSLLASNLGFLAPEDASPVITVLLSSLDLFAIWSVVLLSIGYAIVGRLSKGTAATVVVVGWVIWILIKIGLASLGALFS